MEMRVRCDCDAGLLLLQHASGTADDDFLAIAVDDGRVEVVLNLGKNRPRDPLHIRSGVVVADRRWHTVTFARSAGQFVSKIAADLRPSADGSAVRTSLAAGGG